MTPPLEGCGAQNVIHAAPKGAWPSIPGGRYYKHGAPNGAEHISVAKDTYKVERPGGAFTVAHSPIARSPGPDLPPYDSESGTGPGRL